MNDKVEVYELTPEEWNAAIKRRMKVLGITEADLKRKHSEGKLSGEEFKLWCLVKTSSSF